MDPEHTFCLSVQVALKSALNSTFDLSILTSAGDFKVTRTFKDFQQFHQTIVKSKRYRGVKLPKLPSNPSHANAENHYTNYLREMLHRVVYIKHTISFLNPPTPIKHTMMELYEQQNHASKIGSLKKRGHKFKAFRNRYFALYPSYIMEYYEKQISYLTPKCNPKGCIDLTLVRRILVDQDPKYPHSLKIITNNRDWVIQCYSANDRNEWMKAINGLIRNANYNGYIPERCRFHKNIRDSELLMHGILRNNYEKEDFEESSFQRVISLCIEFYHEDVD
eukprot:64960_1